MPCRCSRIIPITNCDQVLTVTVAVGLQDRPSDAPNEGTWQSDFKLFNNPGFADALSAISTLVFTYAGTPGFFNIISEMRNPQDYHKSLAVCQTAVTAFYIAVATVIYYYCGSYVASPALGSAGVLVKRVAYGLALPGLVITTVVFIHVRIHIQRSRRLANRFYSFRLNTFSFARCEAQSTWHPTRSYTGRPGWGLHLAWHWLHTLLPAEYPSSLASCPSLALCWRRF